MQLIPGAGRGKILGIYTISWEYTPGFKFHGGLIHMIYGFHGWTLSVGIDVYSNEQMWYAIHEYFHLNPSSSTNI